MRRAVLLVVVALAGCLAAAAFVLRIGGSMPDFEVYRTAGARAAAGEPLYRATDGHYQFKYFPATAFVFVPLAAVPVTAAKAAWFALSVGALVGLVALSVGELPHRAVPSSLLVGAALLSLGKFYARELLLGQINLLVALLAVIGLALLLRRRDSGAGAAFAAAALLKPYAVVFLPYLLGARRFRAAAACAMLLAAALAAPALVYGTTGNVELLRAWWDTVTSSTPPLLTNPDNVSIAAMYAKWIGPGPAASGMALATSLALVAAFGAVVRLRHPAVAQPEYLEVALLLTLVVLLAPQGWDYVLLVSTPAVVLLVNALPRLERPLQILTVGCLAGAGLTTFDLMGRAAYGRFMGLSVITCLYAVLVGVLVHLRARRMA
ncbi:MAG: hypothetical protein A3I61_16075 [Acidobacteria bacterium RIFCSPLOWO2_02_FULL_68_18]|nr:MAG: hypothetical protein A3I61_16075 [Acidobacteria bacterium RIFCSPLOWO2_02_FULL_68_18]OFW48951.1 MAG: hypothetical protein A3G77_05150 [Acidobacteria bacterium RIFCSPLOWO2_12_FULL_68_19]